MAKISVLPSRAMDMTILLPSGEKRGAMYWVASLLFVR